MKKYTLICLLLAGLILATGCDDKADDPVANVDNTRYLAIIGFSTLRLFDLTTNELIEEPLGLGNAPNWAIPDGNRMYVINSLSNDINVFEASDGVISLAGSFDIGLGSNNNPYCGVLTSDGDLLVTNLMRNSVSVVDLVNATITDVWATGVAPEGVLVTSDMAFVLNTGFDFNNLRHNRGSIWAFDLETGTRRFTVETGMNSQFGTLDSQGRLHVVCTGNYDNVTGEVRVYQLDPFDEVDAIEFNAYPGRIARGTDGTMYLAAGGFELDGDQHGLVLTYDENTLGALDSIATGTGALDVAVDPETGRLYVACKDAVQLDVVEDDAVIRSINLDDPPQALAVWSFE